MDNLTPREISRALERVYRFGAQKYAVDDWKHNITSEDCLYFISCLHIAQARPSCLVCIMRVPNAYCRFLHQ